MTHHHDYYVIDKQLLWSESSRQAVVSSYATIIVQTEGYHLFTMLALIKYIICD